MGKFKEFIADFLAWLCEKFGHAADFIKDLFAKAKSEMEVVRERAKDVTVLDTVKFIGKQGTQLLCGAGVAGLKKLSNNVVTRGLSTAYSHVFRFNRVGNKKWWPSFNTNGAMETLFDKGLELLSGRKPRWLPVLSWRFT